MSRGRRAPSAATEPTAQVRLYDRLRNIDPSAWPEMPVIVADEIARQIDQAESRGTPPASSYGTLAPPFRQCFIECSTVVDGIAVQRGVLVEDISSLYPDQLTPAHRQIVPPGTRWILSMRGFLRVAPDHKVHTYAALMVLHLDERGYLLDDTGRVQIMQRPGAMGRYNLDPSHLATHAPYALKAISAMHQRTSADRVTPTRQQRRQAERKEGVKQLHEYYVLRVRPARPGASFEEVGQAQRGGERREHIVRGHFRWYSEEKPLFGKFAGCVWVPEHERGSSDIGKIKKDYEV